MCSPLNFDRQQNFLKKDVFLWTEWTDGLMLWFLVNEFMQVCIALCFVDGGYSGQWMCMDGFLSVYEKFL